METQQAYELMRTYLTRPGARRAVARFDGDEFCRYETTIEGELHRCAIGCLLSPAALAETREYYDENLGWNVTGALRDFAGSLGDVLEAGFSVVDIQDCDPEFLNAAQRIHDAEASWESGKFNVALLDDAARDLGLTVIVDDRAPREELVAIV